MKLLPLTAGTYYVVCQEEALSTLLKQTKNGKNDNAKQNKRNVCLRYNENEQNTGYILKAALLGNFKHKNQKIKSKCPEIFIL